MRKGTTRRRALIGGVIAGGAGLAASSLVFACSANMTTATLAVTPNTAPANSSATVSVSGTGYATNSVQVNYLAAGAAGDCHKAATVVGSPITASGGSFLNKSVTITSTGGVGVATLCAQDTNGANGAHAPFVVS